jgi:ribosomal protein S18 acetylase RimI-like enzyme
MRIEIEKLVPPEVADTMWRLYNDAFDELRATAVQRHVMVREEFDDVMRDPRVMKYCGVDANRSGRMCALATFTNQLDAMPLISPDFFRRRWPAHFAEGRIWYIGFVAVHPDYRGTGVFDRVVEEMCRVVSAEHGVAAMDICRRNEEVYRLPQAIHRLLQEYSGNVHSQRFDAQSYWCYEFPAVP